MKYLERLQKIETVETDEGTKPVLCYQVDAPEYLGQNHPIMQLDWVDLWGGNNHLFRFDAKKISPVWTRSFEKVKEGWEAPNSSWWTVCKGHDFRVYMHKTLRTFSIFFKSLDVLNEKIAEFVEETSIQREDEIYLILPLHSKGMWENGLDLRKVLAERYPLLQVWKLPDWTRNPFHREVTTHPNKFHVFRETENFYGIVYDEKDCGKLRYVVYTKKYDIEEIEYFDTLKEANDYWQVHTEWLKSL